MYVIEVDRIVHHGVTYILVAELIHWGSIKIPYLSISVTNKSSRKVRAKKCGYKPDTHFSLLKAEEPIILSRIIINSFSEFLKDYNYVMFSAYEDKRSKRERLYKFVLESIGFELVYKYTRDDYDVGTFLMIKKWLKKPKLKEVRSAFNIMYAHL